MKSRVQMMREALTATRETGHPEYGPLAGTLLGAPLASLHERMKWGRDIIAKPYRDLDPSLFVGFDYPGAVGDAPKEALPSALILANDRGSRRVAVVWSAQTVTFDQPGRTAIIVPLGADDAGERLGAALEKVITPFFDRNQPQ